MPPMRLLMHKIQYVDVDSPRRFNPAIGRDLEAIVLKCLEKEPLDDAIRRPRSLRKTSVAVSLECRCVRDLQPRLQRLLILMRRNRTAVAFSAAIMFCTILGAVFTIARYAVELEREKDLTAKVLNEKAIRYTSKADAEAAREKVQELELTLRMLAAGRIGEYLDELSAQADKLKRRIAELEQENGKLQSEIDLSRNERSALEERASLWSGTGVLLAALGVGRPWRGSRERLLPAAPQGAGRDRRQIPDAAAYSAKESRRCGRGEFGPGLLVAGRRAPLPGADRHRVSRSARGRRTRAIGCLSFTTTLKPPSSISSVSGSAICAR